MEKTVGQMVKEKREAAGLSQLALCKKIGWTANRIYEYERGIRNPKPEALEKIMKALES
ncbi:MAG: Cro/C1-type helix-turn-helix domain protein [Bacteriophage sp.]|nr:MAG: Cro/C1-type helix-turn-helix domain protein [Bacteriophage sp.]